MLCFDMCALMGDVVDKELDAFVKVVLFNKDLLAGMGFGVGCCEDDG